MGQCEIEEIKDPDEGIKMMRRASSSEIRKTLGVFVSFAACLLTGISQFGHAAEPFALKAGEGKRWVKGNTHTHTLWSDGDAAPELAVDWYASRDYDFICLTDHNIIAELERWFPVEGKRLTPARIEDLRKKFGADAVETREKDGVTEMRLKTLAELKSRFEKPNEFIMIPAEEITAKRSVHVNGLNLKELIPPTFGKTTVEILKASFDAVDKQSEKYGVPMMAHLNHPNFSDGVTAEDIIELGGERFFEVYNGHPGVRNWGDTSLGMPSTDRMWDIILSMRLIKGDSQRPLYGMATDDTHAYHKQRIGLANAGRGWVQVLTRELTPDAIITSLKAGEFYASSGVTLDEVAFDGKALKVAVRAEPGVTYKVQFIGTRKGFDSRSEPVNGPDGKPLPSASRKYSESIGVTLAETDANPAVYQINGDELYVRAKVISSKLQANPFAEGDHEMAWTQPVTFPAGLGKSE